MSEEEIIEILEDRDMFIDTLYENYRQSTVTVKPFDKAIQGLLDLYQKEKEKNKELDKDLHDDKEYIRELHHKLTNAIEIKYIHEDYILKSKVREKIEEAKEFKKNNPINEEMYLEVIAWIEELLQKGDK